MIAPAYRENRWLQLWLSGLAAALIGLAAFHAPPADAAESHVIEIRDFQFGPDVIEVAVGDTITWINMDIAPHTATAVDGAWDSGALEQGDEWSLIIEASGSFDYLCTFHPQMTGAVSAN